MENTVCMAARESANNSKAILKTELSYSEEELSAASAAKTRSQRSVDSQSNVLLQPF